MLKIEVSASGEIRPKSLQSLIEWLVVKEGDQR